MRSTTTYSTLLGVFGTLGVLGAPAPLASSAPSAGSGSGSGGSSAFSYTCSGEKDWTDSSGNSFKCQGETVCKDGAPGGPCVWPDNYRAASGALSQAAVVATSAGGSVPPVSSAGGGASFIPPLPTGSVTLAGSSQSQPPASVPFRTSASALSSALAGGSGQSSAGGSITAASSTVASSASTKAGNTTTSTSSSSSGSGGTKFVGYWENHSNLGGVEASQLDGITHVVLSFIDLSTWTTFADSKNGNFDPSTAGTLRGMKSDVKVMAALGGWGLDGPIKTAADGGEAAITTLVTNAKNAMTTLNLDGLDLDWEFPTAAQQPAFISMCKQLKAAIQEVKPNGILSVAIGSRSTQTDPKTGGKDVDAMTSETFSELNDVVDMWNVMTYDFVNRYDTKTGHQSGGKVVSETLEFYQGVGIAMNKVNIGFLNTAKYFNLTETPGCTAANPIGCDMGGVQVFETGGDDNGKSGWLRYNVELDKWQGDELSKTMTELRTNSWEKKPDDSQTAFEAEKAHAWYDEAQKLFWTWTTADDNKSVCEEWKSKVGGMMVWSMNQDENGPAGGSHMQALASCVKG
ncbi:hypothetical protein I302_103800 [Kwoniella bestiolae CBS 10118]|uniref:GH18 domain-containing protein n=1 Tax=Kwoniella bestiolae CBS 10118 TaxID=1296100 RepID=A0AAJ8M6T4_9TREE